MSCRNIGGQQKIGAAIDMAFVLLNTLASHGHTRQGIIRMASNEISSSKWRVEDAKPEHKKQILELFKAVFGQEITPEHWHWKYAGGRGAGIVVWEGDKIISFFGGMERRIIFKGQPKMAFQCGDSMVAEKHRGTLSKRGPFFLSCAAFLDKFLGYGRPYLISYGFPNERAMRLAERLKMYTQIGTMVDVSWPAKSDTIFSAEAFSFDSPRHVETLENLWSSMASEFCDRAIGIRDPAYMRHRYHNHPALDYQLNLVYRHDENHALGLLVTRQVEDRLMLVDVVCRKQGLRNLVSFGRSLASSSNSTALYGWLTEVDCPLIADSDESITSPPLRLPFGVYREGLDPEEIRDKWFFMCGDSDFL